jgi:peptidoglycan/LPS O-acetylase OafA/YrhL
VSQLRYRADIDGLRAVAVMGVIAYHAVPGLLPGGFTGVDIFFVISGYLISGILYRAVVSGTFTFREFYARRIRRLFPALITLLLLCMCYGWVLLLPDELRRLGKQVAAGTFFLQNFVLWQESGYFDVSANLKPLLHLWSLAVEEQFYILFPPVMILIWRRRWPFVPVMGALLLASFVLNIVMSFQDPVPDFFLTPYRSWEFLAGALLAWHHFGRGHGEERHGLWMAPLGGLLLVLGMTVLNSGQPYPGWRALLPVCGSLLVIGAGPSSWMNRCILSFRPVVLVGLVSYPLYLFHWPLLSFLHLVRGPHPSGLETFAALLLAGVLAVATYLLIEKTLRRNPSRIILPGLIGLFLFCGAAGLLVWKGVIPAREVAPEVVRIREALADNDIMQGLPQSGRIWINRIGGAGPQTLVLGDSNAQMYIARITKILEMSSSRERGVLLVTASGVPPLPDVDNPLKKSCPFLIPTFREVLACDPRVDHIVIAALWNQYFYQGYGYLFRGEPLSRPDVREKALEAFGSMIRGLVDSGKPVTVVLDIPFGENFDPKGLLGRDFLGRCRLISEAPLRDDYLRKSGPIRDRIAAVARAGGATVIDPLGFLCDGDRCLIMDGDGPVRFDQGHLRPGFVREKASWIDGAILPSPGSQRP